MHIPPPVPELTRPPPLPLAPAHSHRRPESCPRPGPRRTNHRLACRPRPHLTPSIPTLASVAGRGDLVARWVVGGGGPVVRSSWEVEEGRLLEDGARVTLRRVPVLVPWYDGAPASSAVMPQGCFGRRRGF